MSNVRLDSSVSQEVSWGRGGGEYGGDGGGEGRSSALKVKS